MMAVVSSVATVRTGFPQWAMSGDMGDIRKAALEALDVRGSNRIGGERSRGGLCGSVSATMVLDGTLEFSQQVISSSGQGSP